MKSLKITITGSLGNIGKPLTQKLVAAGHQVTLLSSDAGKKEAIEALGAIPVIGSMTDLALLSRIFTGADAVFTMVPPKFDAPDNRQYYIDIAQVYAEAIRKSGVKRVVQLSSVGAHLSEGTGPIKGIYALEQIFNGLEDVSVTYLRAGFFYTNFLGNIDMIKHMNILGSNNLAENKLMLVHPEDIADAAAHALQEEGSGKQIQYVISDEQSNAAIAKALGTAVGKPELPWVNFSDEDMKDGLLQAGFPPHFADLYAEMGLAAREGKLWEDYILERKAWEGKIKLEDFAKEFAEKY